MYIPVIRIAWKQLSNNFPPKFLLFLAFFALDFGVAGESSGENRNGGPSSQGAWVSAHSEHLFCIKGKHAGVSG